MEQKVYHRRQGFDTIDELKDAIQNAWQSLSHRFIKKSVDKWREKLHVVVNQRGGHFEHILE